MGDKKEEPNMGVFDTHKFLFTLYYENQIEGKKVLFLDRNGEEKTITISSIEIGPSPVSCKLYCENNNRHLIPFLRIRKVFDKTGELIWDNTDADLSNTKIIKGHK